MFDSLVDRGFQVEYLSHAKAILGADFPTAAAELESALAGTTIPIEEIIAGGGGEAKGTQRLRRALTAKGWVKTTFIVEKRINDVPRESQSHEVDHVREFEDGSRIALEIEWNNKDPFYDRDLENFKRLHADGAISVGIIVTRGKSLHENMRKLVKRFLDERQIQNLDDLKQWGYDPTTKQRGAINKRSSRAKNPLLFGDAFTDKFVADKFGEATTHWRKLEDRVRRGVGNPCPLVLIGLPDTILGAAKGARAINRDRTLDCRPRAAAWAGAQRRMAEDGKFVGRGIRPKAEGENCRMEPLLARLAWLSRKNRGAPGSAGVLKPFKVGGDSHKRENEF